MSIVEETLLIYIHDSVAEISGIAELMMQIPEDSQINGITVNNISKVLLKVCDVINDSIKEIKGKDGTIKELFRGADKD